MPWLCLEQCVGSPAFERDSSREEVTLKVTKRKWQTAGEEGKERYQV